MPVRGVLAVVVLLLGAVAVSAFPAPAAAHPSPLDSLTLDLVLDRAGLVMIDAASNHDTYDQAPSVTARAALAAQVLEAIGMPRDTVQVDAESSVLYHEVGFTLSFHEAFSNGDTRGWVRIDSAPLQAIAASFGTLTLEVCRAPRAGLALEVDASAPSGVPDRWGAGSASDRADCHTWRLAPGDPAVAVTARVDGTGPTAPVAQAHVSLPCGEPTFGDPTFLDAGAIARSARTVRAHVTGSPSGHLLEGDTVVAFSTRTRVDLVVPGSERGHLSFGAPDGPRATRRLRVPECKYDQARPWTVSSLRIWVDEARCVPVIVRTPESERTVRFPVGVPCP